MKIQWRGREWTVRAATASELDVFMDDKAGLLVDNQSLVLFNSEMPKDVQIQAVLHEVGHIMFPEWVAEPHEKSKSEVGIFERDMAAFLTACGINLRPLIRGEAPREMD